MTPVFTLKRNGVGPSLREFAGLMRKGAREIVHRAAKGITRRVIDITPPSSGEASGRDARKVGEKAIARDLNYIFAPKRLKGRRKVTHVFGRRLRRPVFVQTKERHPDVAGLYRQHTHFRGRGVGVRFSASSVGRKFYVDTRKFQALLRAKTARVGTLAAGWSAAAHALDVPLQQWIGRHGSSGGRVQIDTAGERMRVVVENLAPTAPANVRAELARRIPPAVRYQEEAMLRDMQHALTNTRRQLGIKHAA
jgi:hypothetical protein